MPATHGRLVRLRSRKPTLLVAAFGGCRTFSERIPGVIETRVGYAGGTTRNPTYDDVKTGRTGHAETVRVVFDPKRLSFADLLENWFFRMHDPTTPNQQGNDHGSQYRSAIFYVSDAQRKTALAVIERVQTQGRWKRPIVTQVVEAGPFTDAEEYHQDYLVKYPSGYTCHYLRD
ncbi:MAG: peptide-methionine (S)-S-oxide reductase MsrA [Polyangiaceae bacterium]